MNYRHYVERVLIPRFYLNSTAQFLAQLNESSNDFLFFIYLKTSRMYNEPINEFPSSYIIEKKSDFLTVISYDREMLEEGDFTTLYLVIKDNCPYIFAEEYNSKSKHLLYTLKEGDNTFIKQYTSKDDIIEYINSL